MSASLAVQYIIIALAVLVSACFVIRSRFPRAVRRLRVTLALPLLAAGRPAWQYRLGRWIAPPGQKQGQTCGGCDGCA